MRQEPAAYPVTPDEVRQMFVEAGLVPAAAHIEGLARHLSEAMPAFGVRVTGVDAFAEYRVVDHEGLAAVRAMRQAIKRRWEAGPKPWDRADWLRRLDVLDRALVEVVTILCGPTASLDALPERRWHRDAWTIAELARVALAEVGHVRQTVSRGGPVARFTVAALARIGHGQVSSIAVEKLHNRRRRAIEASSDKEGDP